MRISDWSSDVCSSDLLLAQRLRAAERLVDRLGQRPGRLAATTAGRRPQALPVEGVVPGLGCVVVHRALGAADDVLQRGFRERRVRDQFVEPVHVGALVLRSEEHTSELQSLMRISYAVFCLKKKTHTTTISTSAS